MGVVVGRGVGVDVAVGFIVGVAEGVALSTIWDPCWKMLNTLETVVLLPLESVPVAVIVSLP